RRQCVRAGSRQGEVGRDRLAHFTMFTARLIKFVSVPCDKLYRLLLPYRRPVHCVTKQDRQKLALSNCRCWCTVRTSSRRSLAQISSREFLCRSPSHSCTPLPN